MVGGGLEKEINGRTDVPKEKKKYLFYLTFPRNTLRQ